MNPGLRYLLRRVPVRLWRNVRKRARGVKGALALIATVVFLVFIVLSQAASGMASGSEEAAPWLLAERIRLFAPLGMLMFTLLSIFAGAQGRGGLYFKPEEVDFLFPAPLTRRQLLVYQVASRVQIQLLSAVWVSIFVIQHTPHWLGCILGTFLALVFLQLLAQAVGLASAALGKRLARPFRWGLILVILAALGLGARSALAAIRLDEGPMAAMRAVAQSPGVRVLTAPFAPFVNTFASLSTFEVLVWAAASLATLLGLLAVLAKLDVAYEETALEVSADVQRKIKRIRSGGGAFAALKPGRKRFSVPRFPRMEGAGALAWRQTIEITRSMKAVMMMAAMILIWPAIVAGVLGFADVDDPGRARALAGATLPMVLTLSIVATQNLPFDFRRDLDRMAYLRTLPLRPMAIAAGQIAPSAVLLALLLTAATGAIAGLVELVPWAFTPAIFPTLLPFTWAVMSVDNALFLVFPHRVDPEDPGNVGFMGRMMLVMFLKFLALGVVVGVATTLGVLVGWLAGNSALLGVLTGVGALVAFDVVLTWIVGRAFAAFDPGSDVPV